MRITRNELKRRALLCAALLASVSCSGHPAAPAASTNRVVAATTPSAPVAPPNAVARLCALHPPLKAQLLAYRAKEGDAHRSGEFADLASQLDQTCMGGTFVRTRTLPADRPTEIEVLSFLGLPARGRRVGADAAYVYPYWRADTNSQWVVVVDIKDGMLEQIGWNDLGVNDFPAMTQYSKWSDVLGTSGK